MKRCIKFFGSCFTWTAFALAICRSGFYSSIIRIQKHDLRIWMEVALHKCIAASSPFPLTSPYLCTASLWHVTIYIAKIFFYFETVHTLFYLSLDGSSRGRHFGQFVNRLLASLINKVGPCPGLPLSPLPFLSCYLLIWMVQRQRSCAGGPATPFFWFIAWCKVPAVTTDKFPSSWKRMKGKFPAVGL